MNENEEFVTLCEKINVTQIYSPTTVWKDFHDIFTILQKEVIVSSNRVMSVCNIYNSFMSNEEKLKWIADNYSMEKKNIRNVLYKTVRDNSLYSYSLNASAASSDIYKKYFSGMNSYKNKIKQGEGNPPMTFTKTIPLYTTVQKYKIECVDYEKGYYTIELPFLNNEAMKGIKLKRKQKDKNGKDKNKTITLEPTSNRLKFGINTGGNKRLTDVIFNIMNGTYKFGDSKLKRVDSKRKGHKYDYIFLLSYSKPKKQIKELKEENVLGIDLGMNIPAYCATNYNEYRRKAIGDTTIIRKNKEQERINRKAQKSIKYNLRDGKGRAYKLDGYDGSNNKIANRNSTYNFNIAREIVDNAIKWDCGVIKMEDLTGITASRPDDRFLKSWTYYDLQSKIENKAKENGIIVKYINPYRTSQTCSKCGHWEAGQRLNQSTFCCKSCGYTVNADYNAARNISMSDKYVREKSEVKKDA